MNADIKTKDDLIMELRSQLACAIALIKERDHFMGGSTPTSEEMIADAKAVLALAIPKR